MILTDIDLDQARALQELIMTSTVRINKPGEKVLDRDTGEYVYTPGPVIYTGKANIQSGATAASPSVAGGDTIMVALVIVKAPWDTTGVLPGQVVTVLTADDPDLPTRELVVTAANVNGMSVTCRRIVCTDLLDN